MEARYLELLHGLSQRGLATRSRVEVERMLCVCSHCQHWTADGCARMTTREFATLLSNSQQACSIERNEP